MSSVDRDRVLVTGATGFVGRAAVDGLGRHAFDVRRALRTRSASPRAGDVVVGDLAAPTDLDSVMRGVGAVVHLAGRVHVMDGSVARRDEEFMAVNAHATRQLAEAAARNGVRRFIFLSTIKVNGERTDPGRPFTESDPPAPADAYARSKLAAERALEELQEKDPTLAVTILRPPLVYGPGVGANFRRLLDAVARGVPLPLGRVRNRRSLIYLDNLVDLIVQAVAGRPVGTYLVADSPPVSTPRLIAAMAEALDRSPRLVPVPLPAVRLLGSISRRRGTVDRLIESLEVDATRAAEAFDAGPVGSMAEAMRRTADWFIGQRR